MEKRGTTETSCIARASNLEVLGMDLCTSILGITIPNPDEMELPEFVQSIPTSVGDEIATDGTQNICLPFCILWWNSIRWRPWQTVTFCGPSPEAIQQLVDLSLQGLQAMGFQCRAMQGVCQAE